MSIHPQILEKDGEKAFVVLPYEEFIHIQSELEDYDDLRTLREEKAASSDEPTGVWKLTCVSEKSALGTNSVPSKGNRAMLLANTTSAMPMVASLCLSDQRSAPW